MSTDGTDSPKRADPRSRKRLPVEARRAQIIEKATEIFTDHGFSANTRMLARELGTTQPLLYRYFSGKEELIQTVLEDIHQKHASIDWIAILSDRSRPLRDRLIGFAEDYAAKVYDRVWIRTYMYAGLNGGEYNRRYIANTTEPILRTIAAEIRHDLQAGRPPSRAVPRVELETLWLFHGGLYYHAIRRHIYGLDVDDETFRAVLHASVDGLLHSMRTLIAPAAH